MRTRPEAACANDMLATVLMPRVPTGAPFEERGGRLRGALDLLAGRYPRFVLGGGLRGILPVFHFHEATAAALEPKFAYLADNQYRTIDSEELGALVRHGRQPAPRSVMLAFDDAWASLWLVVGPLLKRYGLRAVTYAIPGRIADADALRPTLDVEPVDPAAADRAPNPFVTWPELRLLSSVGLIDVQSHTWSHSMMFSGDKVIGRTDARLDAEPMLNRPRIDADGPPEFLTPDRVGYPLMERRSRMSDALRFVPDPEAAAMLEATAGGEPMVPFAGRIKGRWETAEDQRAAIEDELVRSRDVLEQQLQTNVRHICLPWGVAGDITRQALQRTGFQTAFANRMGGTFAVAPGDDPYYLKRLSERYIFALPGHGRRTFTFFT
jgi:peptidoglycan/xylan/chitin deacetylase (PgdA/CDA1 family)